MGYNAIGVYRWILPKFSFKVCYLTAMNSSACANIIYQVIFRLTVNIGTMTRKSREVAEMLKRRQVEIACVQETKWKGNKPRVIGEGYKLYNSGASKTRNGVGITLHSEWEDKILEVKRKKK